MRLLHRPRPPGEAGHVHVRALDIERLSAPVRLEHLDDLGQPFNPHARAIHRDAEPLVLGGHPPGAEPHLEAAIRHHVEGRELFGQHDRVVIVDAEHTTAHAQPGRRHRRRGHRGQRRNVNRAVPGRVGDVAWTEVVVGREQG